MNDRVRVELEHLWRVAAEGAGAKGDAGGQREGLASAREGGEIRGSGDCGPREIAEELHELPQTGALAGGAHIIFVRDDLVVKRGDVADIRPHLEQHDAEIIFLAATPTGECGVGADVAQQRGAKFREGRDLPRQAR